MRTSTINRFSDFLEMLDGELEPFRYPALDLAARYGQPYERQAVDVLQKLELFARRCGESVPEALRLYAAHVRQLVEERIAFNQGAGRYGGTAEEIDELLRGERFKRIYLYALTLSTILDRCRYETAQDYRQSVRQNVKRGGAILEIGAGNCLDALFSSELGSVDAYERNDLSLVWQQLLGLAGRINLVIGDYDFRHQRRYDFVAMIELLEHLPDPARYIRGAERVLKDGGLAYLTFALRMPQADHLQCFTSIDECREMVCSADLGIVYEQCLIDTYMTFDEGDRWRLAAESDAPVTYCCLARKRQPSGLAFLLRDFNETLDA